jgi:EAL domain-containing protein (putative c-di-GMP-specific phosphodiesterase class I)
MVLEVHEEAVADSLSMHKLRDQLAALGIGLAYDDFGAGQARLQELVEVPPHFLKLHMSLIRGIDQDVTRQELIQALNPVITKLGVQVIAEGIETEQEAGVCLGLGCHLGQGFLFGRPQPAAPSPEEGRTFPDALSCTNQ